jgi:hypothetical protein
MMVWFCAGGSGNIEDEIFVLGIIFILFFFIEIFGQSYISNETAGIQVLRLVIWI